MFFFKTDLLYCFGSERDKFQIITNYAVSEQKTQNLQNKKLYSIETKLQNCYGNLQFVKGYEF